MSQHEHTVLLLARKEIAVFGVVVVDLIVPQGTLGHHTVLRPVLVRVLLRFGVCSALGFQLDLILHPDRSLELLLHVARLRALLVSLELPHLFDKLEQVVRSQLVADVVGSILVKFGELRRTVLYEKFARIVELVLLEKLLKDLHGSDLISVPLDEILCLCLVIGVLDKASPYEI